MRVQIYAPQSLFSFGLEAHFSRISVKNFKTEHPVRILNFSDY
ncbi:hypothetical protein CAMGR0001_0585 [Campylobacter gracilis RM3268]|uniref:Uncharacterized protein n=1 Tax=Campylobacter gracilis RM3268 TaxID=553220 RepID=C8PHY9_9BACT|nr:hypothetical protein CAMGR0001_0585 [Campylobacter gracilis RM3268]